MTDTSTINEGPRRGRGFASLSPARRKEIASMGGKAAAAQGKGHRFTSQEARAAGRLGGKISRRRRVGR